MKLICIGLNYYDHASEMNRDIPAEPLVFMKPDSSLVKNNKPFFIPEFSSEIHYEAELVISICRVGRSIAPRFAHRYFDKITVGIDFTARDLQRKQSAAGLPWEIAKGFDGSAQLGQLLDIKDIENTEDIKFCLDKNGSRVQEGFSSNMIFGFSEIISYVSRFFTLKTGDLIFTGTPAGVGAVKKDDRLTAYLENHKVLDFYVK
ncbi:MAG: fumarylacetoacetate hydrolase family protein [Marinilabiliaceae bacterium]|jgi:2-keto-4-pentenoate hydratase/2-oxohepta-3-ene-1,7-dioic acid hydratase in catechol pathway|nr:fumarylacetoacetate hydrolase family protein [Marinilabiliaceae bacterium]